MERRIFCLGRPIIDVMAEIDSNFLRDIGIDSLSSEIRCTDTDMRNLLDKVIRGGTSKAHLSLGGVETNFAINCALLGVPSTLVGSIGEDDLVWDYEKKIREYVDNLKLLLARIRSYLTATVIVLSVSSHRDQRERVKIIHYGASDRLEFGDSAKSELRSCTIFFSSLFSANTFQIRSTWEKAFQLAKTLQKKIIISLAGISTVQPAEAGEILEIIEEADIIFMNEHEYAICDRLSNITPERLFSRSEILVVTYGERGAIIYSRGEKIIVPARDVKGPIYEIGAGDAFAAGFIAALSRGINMEEAGEIGSQISSLKIECPESHLTPEIVRRFKGGGNHALYG